MSEKHPQVNWYDLPRYYDLSFSHEMREELAFLKRIFPKSDHHTPHLIEPACGTGRLIVPLVRAGYRCSGYDSNEKAIDYLKKNSPETISLQRFLPGRCPPLSLKGNTMMALSAQQIPFVISPLTRVRSSI